MKTMASSLLAVSLFIPVCVRASLADTNLSPRLTVELRDGSRVVGASVGKNFQFRSALLGEFKLATKEVRTVEFTTNNAAKLVTTGGDALTVVFADDALAMQTGFGKVELAPAFIRKISVSVIGTASAHRPGLVALWSGEDSGKDFAGNNDLDLNNVSFADGQLGRAFEMNGFSSCMKLADTASLNPGTGDGLTLSAWIKPESVSGFHLILEWNPSDKMPGVVGAQIALGHTPGSVGVLQANVVDTQGGHHILTSASGVVVPGRFQLVAVTYDKATGSGVLYVNGIEVARGQWGSFTPLTTGDLWISRRPTDHPGDWTYNAFFSGLLDEISIYNRALTAEEIKSVCTEENHGEPPPPPVISPGRPFYNGINRGGFSE